eukprot:TRINITY_DN8233_c0_g1_i1.p1 TRINITY_DN8233_c0_g1~~TRINITY_DN8233_c0_g1_i1.p1  ORF type:complete len:198 (-),score=10.09 TRINITY_DN8233_c0_g1_i1:18-611(-)
MIALLCIYVLFGVGRCVSPDPRVYLTSVSAIGTGCPPGSVDSSLNTDRFTLAFWKFSASVGSGIPVTESRKNCQISVRIHVPSGWQYSIVDVTFRGYVMLDSGLRGTQKSTYYFQGERLSASASSAFNGPISDSYEVSDRLNIQSKVWMPCGTNANLNINAEVRIDNTRNKNGEGLMTTDSVDGKVTQIYQLLWRRC